MNKQIYIIGPVTGIDRKEAVAAFAKAASMVKEIGMVPVNPTEFVPAETPWREAMKLCINRLLVTPEVNAVSTLLMLLTLVVITAASRLMLPIELISNFARLLSLSIRLFGNIMAKETLLGILFMLAGA